MHGHSMNMELINSPSYPETGEQTDLSATAKPWIISPALGPVRWIPKTCCGLCLWHITCRQDYY